MPSGGFIQVLVTLHDGSSCSLHSPWPFPASVSGLVTFHVDNYMPELFLTSSNSYLHMHCSTDLLQISSAVVGVQRVGGPPCG